MTVRLPQTKYDTPERVRAYFVTALERLRSLPGVTTASAIDSLPTEGGSVQPIVVDGKPERTVRVTADRLYTLVTRPQIDDHLLELHFIPGLAGYAFTFG